MLLFSFKLTITSSSRFREYVGVPIHIKSYWRACPYLLDHAPTDIGIIISALSTTDTIVHMTEQYVDWAHPRDLSIDCAHPSDLSIDCAVPLSQELRDYLHKLIKSNPPHFYLNYI